MSTLKSHSLNVCVGHIFPSKVNNRNYPKLKEVDDVLGGAAAWENVDSTPGKCLIHRGHPFYAQAPIGL